MFWRKYIHPYRVQAVVGFLFKSAEAVLELMVPLVVVKVIDVGVANNDTGYISHMALYMYGLALAGYACSLVCQYFASVTSQGFGTLVRRDMFEAVNRYDYDTLDILGTPTLITRIANDVNQLQLAVAMTIRLVSRNPVLIFGSLIMAMIVNREIGLIFLCIAPLIALAIWFVMSHSQPIYTKVQTILDDVSLITRENLSGVRVIRAFNKQGSEKVRFNKVTETQKDHQLKAGNISALMNPMTTVIVNTGIILILYVSGVRVNTGALTQGEVIALINYMNQILLSMYAFANVILIYVKAGASSARVQEVLNLKPLMSEGEKDAPQTYDHLLEFDNVSFSYHSGEALSHISFTADPGETIGIIGGTGSGKSSLVNLIPRFYDVSEGSVKVMGQDVRDYKYDALRHLIGLVPQQATLFSGTVRSNLLWGNPNASEEDIQSALDISQAKEIVDKMDKGLDTTIEASGKNVSGGQRQRLTIARALVRKPDILILDDSASALDFATDAKLRKALRTLDCTTIIVSQRVSAIESADKILVLNHGALEDIGTHDELMERCTLYQEIVASQRKGDNA